MIEALLDDPSLDDPSLEEVVRKAPSHADDQVAPVSPTHVEEDGFDYCGDSSLADSDAFEWSGGVAELQSEMCALREEMRGRFDGVDGVPPTNLRINASVEISRGMHQVPAAAVIVGLHYNHKTKLWRIAARRPSDTILYVNEDKVCLVH